MTNEKQMVEELDVILIDNKIRTDGARKISELLMTNTSLTSLGLGSGMVFLNH